jgi:NADH dehydrogenase [ubiquinone] 1 alpha subcomplex assembly factor 6
MFSHRVLRHGLKKASLRPKVPRRGIVTEADVDQARNYCLNQLRYAPFPLYELMDKR